MHSTKVQLDEPEKVEQMSRCYRTLTEKRREYRISIVDKKKSNLVSKIIRKPSEISDLVYSCHNTMSIKEELAQVNDIYRLIVEIIDEMTVMYVNYLKEILFVEIGEKVFSVKHKAHNWLREGENGAKREKGSKSSGPRLTSSGSSWSSTSRSSRVSSKVKAMQEKQRLADLRTEKETQT